MNKLNRVWTALVAAVLCAHAYAAPELTVEPSSGTARPGKPYSVVYEVTWSGAPNDYRVLPAEFDPIEWGTAELAYTESGVRDSMNFVAQTVEFTPSESGEFEIPEIRIRFSDPGANPPSAQTAPLTAPPGADVSPALRAQPLSLVVLPGLSPTWLVCGLGIPPLLAACGAWLYIRRRRKVASSASAQTSSPAFSDVMGAVNAAKQSRLDGNFYGFYDRLCQAAAHMSASPENDDFVARLRKKTQDAGYRGVRPTDDEMEGDLRDVERAVAKWRRKAVVEP